MSLESCPIDYYAPAVLNLLPPSTEVIEYRRGGPEFTGPLWKCIQFCKNLSQAEKDCACIAFHCDAISGYDGLIGAAEIETIAKREDFSVFS